MNLAGLNLTEDDVVAVGKRLIPRVFQEDWLRGKKVARMLESAGQPHLFPLMYNQVEHVVDGTAVCLQPGRSEHRPPVVDGCSCGFYAMFESSSGLEQIITELSASVAVVVLDVELGGRVLQGYDPKSPAEAPLGWRAERQRILRVSIPDKCRFPGRTVRSGCWLPATAVSTTDDVAALVMEHAGMWFGFGTTCGRAPYFPVCDRHLGDQPLSTADLANLWGTEVDWWPTPRPA